MRKTDGFEYLIKAAKINNVNCTFIGNRAYVLHTERKKILFSDGHARK